MIFRCSTEYFLILSKQYAVVITKLNEIYSVFCVWKCIFMSNANKTKFEVWEQKDVLDLILLLKFMAANHARTYGWCNYVVLIKKPKQKFFYRFMDQITHFDKDSSKSRLGRTGLKVSTNFLSSVRHWGAICFRISVNWLLGPRNWVNLLLSLKKVVLFNNKLNS